MIDLAHFYKPLQARGKESSVTQDWVDSSSNILSNMDHPDAIDFDLLETFLISLANGVPFSVPRWSYATHSRETETTLIDRPDIVIFKGPLILYKKRVREVFDLRVFVVNLYSFLHQGRL
jgi:uridine kinase